SAKSPRGIASSLRSSQWQYLLAVIASEAKQSHSGSGRIVRLRNRSLEQHQRGAVFDRRGILDEDAGDPAGARRADLVHYLHRLDDQQGLAFGDRIADPDEGWRAGLGGEIGDADDRRRD